jgi:hypothetical protein
MTSAPADRPVLPTIRVGRHLVVTHRDNLAAVATVVLGLMAPRTTQATPHRRYVRSWRLRRALPIGTQTQSYVLELPVGPHGESHSPADMRVFE